MSPDTLRPVPVHVRTLGTLALDAPREVDAESLLRQPKRLAFFLFLLLRERDAVVSRDRLMAVFWPDSPPSRARPSLRQSLRFVRSCLPGVVVTEGRHAVGVHPERVRCDLLEFHALADAGRLTDALALYRGELLDGFHFSNAGQGFESWLEERRTRCRRRACEAAWRLATSSLEMQRPVEAAFWGKRAVGLGPMNETSVQRLMRLLDKCGDRTGALRAYTGFKEWLDRELEAAPSPETRALAERIRTDQPPENMVELGERRTGFDRRAGKNRRTRSEGPPHGRERRSGGDRRGGKPRRSGQDRRTRGNWGAV